MKQFETLSQDLTQILTNAGFSRVLTPTFEDQAVYTRSLGEASDLVQKEFFKLQSRNEHQYVLRPEATASVIRMVVQEKLMHKQPLPLKFFYLQPMFRYERPQSGRLREFFQLGIELVGSKNYHDDIEVLLVVHQIITTYKLTAHTTLKLNYLGDIQTKIKWNQALQAHFSHHRAELSELNQARIDKNPLRILDDKEDNHLDCVKNAPQINQFWSPEDQQIIHQIKTTLTNLHIPFEWTSEMVRGLDYYSGLIFEVCFNGLALKGQNTILGGGRYNNLLSEFGAEANGCVGFALGLERFLIALAATNYQWNSKSASKIYLASLVAPDQLLWDLIQLARAQNLTIITNWSVHKLDKHFKQADHYQADFLLLYGPKEQQNRQIICKSQKYQINQQITFEQPQFALQQITIIIKNAQEVYDNESTPMV